LKYLPIIMLLAALLALSLPAAASAVPDQIPQPVYRIPLLVHLGDSDRPAADFRTIFAEINRIWLNQAGICFEIEAVKDDREPEGGLDMWFHPFIAEMIGLNGYYDGEKIQMKDHPVLALAPHPSSDGAARTAAHELGHALGLKHNQSARDNLMASKTYGWHLNHEEVGRSRRGAVNLALPDSGRQSCNPPRFVGFGNSRAWIQKNKN
jgi:hypothetical protein